MSAVSPDDVVARWTRARLCELVTGRMLILRDEEGESRPIPAWLSAVAAPSEVQPWIDDITATHPSDRSPLMRTWWSAVTQPGELQSHVVRRRFGGELHICRVVVLNMCDVPDLGMLVVVEDQGRYDGPDWDDGSPPMDATSTDWVLEHLDEYGVKLWMQGKVEAIYGRPVSEVIGRVGNDFLNPVHHGPLFDLWMEMLERPRDSKTIRLEVLRPDGSSLWVESMLINQLADERIGAIVCLSHDITQEIEREAEQRAHAEELQRSHEAFQTLAEQVPAGVFHALADGSLQFMNRQGLALLGATEVDDLRAVVHPDDVRAVRACLRTLASPFGPESASVEIRSLDGQRVLSFVCRAVGDTGGRTREIVGSITDVTSNHELRHHAEHDALTGLLNRRTVDRYLAEVLERDAREVLVAFVDLDGFKAVNDESGHDAGDEVLRQVAARLRHSVRPTDDVGRYGGDEFVIIHRNAASGAEQPIEERVRSALEAPIVWPGGRWNAGASVGFARPQPGECADAVIRRADQAMYRAKRARRVNSPYASSPT